MPYLGLLGALATFQPRRRVQPRPTSWSSIRLDGLYSCDCLYCLDALSCWSLAAFCCCSGLALLWTAGLSLWAVLISSYCSTSDLVMIHMMSVKYVFSLSLVLTQVCSLARGLNQPGQRPLTDTDGPQLPETCRLMT